MSQTLGPRPPDKDEVKAALPLVYACHRLGVGLDSDGRARCPFHSPDDDPSFYLWHGDDGVERWWCQPCGFGGDVFDLIQRLEGVGFWDSVDRAAELLAEIPEGYVAPAAVRPARQGPADWAPFVAESRARAAEDEWAGRLSAWSGIEDFHDAAACRGADRVLRDVLGWGCDHFGAAVMPHWSRAGELTGCKVREPSGNRRSLEGSRYAELYGAWLGLPHRDVLLCEGETDVGWATVAAAREQVPVTVLGLASGAGKKPDAEQLNCLAGARAVYLALDPDGPGVDAAREWADALSVAGIRCLLCRLPKGRDLKDARPLLSRLLAQAREPLPQPANVAALPHGYEVAAQNGNVRGLTNWTLEPVAALSGGDDGPGFQVDVLSRGHAQPDVVRYSDLSSVAAVRRWANARGLLFTGSDRDAQLVAEHLEWRGAFVPEVFQTDRAGLHTPPDAYGFAGPSVVFPGGYSGKLPWLYAPGPKKADLSGQVLLPPGEPGPFDWAWLEDFLALSHPSVTGPMLAWVCAAARRPEVRDFPLMFVGGPSGSGKSTLAKLALRLAGSRVEAPLGSVTPYVLMQRLASTTSLPVFVDEWTRLSRRDAREQLQGLIPTIYEGGVGERGQSDLQVVRYRLTSPVMIAGEDTMHLDRELDRVVAVEPRAHWQDPAALSRVQGRPLERFADMLHWFVSEAELPPLAPAVSPTRPDHNRAVLLGGWETARALLERARQVGEDAPELPDLVLDAGEDADPAMTENVYEEAVRECAQLRDASGLPVVWAGDGGTWVRFNSLLGVAERHLDLELPGRSRAARAYFRGRYRLRDGKAQPPMHPGVLRATLIEGFVL